MTTTRPPAARRDAQAANQHLMARCRPAPIATLRRSDGKTAWMSKEYRMGSIKITTTRTLAARRDAQAVAANPHLRSRRRPAPIATLRRSRSDGKTVIRMSKEYRTGKLLSSREAAARRRVLLNTVSETATPTSRGPRRSRRRGENLA